MGLLLKASGISKAFGIREVLDEVSFQIAKGERVGLIGPNGCGKSTLLKIVAGLLPPDEGHVSLPDRPVVGYLPQESDFDRDVSVIEAVTTALPHDPPLWEAAEVLAGLQFPDSRWHQAASTLSGGERTRLMLARLLLSQPDLLLLDEPTNHLDLRMLEWLEAYLQRFRGALLVISHDRRFLDNTVTRILELDSGRMREFGGGYAFYVRKKEEELRRQQIEYQRQQEEIQALQAFISRVLSRASQISEGPKRGRDFYGRVASKVAKRAKAAQRRMDRIDRINKPWEGDSLQARFQPKGRHGQWAVHGENLTRRFGQRVLFSSLNLDIAFGERVAIIGPNGSGKTTLIRTLLGQDAPEAGKSEMGAAVKVGYLAQHGENMNPENTLLQEVMDERSATETEVRTLLACFLFRRDEVFKKVESLSSGERVRLALAKLLASGCNLMVLDEPTHHLDIATRERMEEALKNYTGTLLLVSHDRLLLDRLAERLVILENGTVTQYPGNYSDFMQREGETSWVEGTLNALNME